MYGNPAVLASPLEETGTKLFIDRPATLTALKEPPDPHNSIHRLTHVIILARLKEKSQTVTINTVFITQEKKSIQS